MSKPTSKKQQDGSPAATFFILLATSVVVFAIGSLVLLGQDTSVHNQKLWLISRAAALTAYVVLTAIVLLGIILSHPRNKDTWRLTAKLLPWHQAAVGILFSLLVIHLIFSLADSKSGVSVHVFWNPTHSKYHPFATLYGVIGLYLLLIVGITSGLRKWVKFWLPIHRVSWILWFFVSLHGFYDGTDSANLKWLYELSAGLLFIAFFWRHWVNNRRRVKVSVQVNTSLKGGEIIESHD